jgi:hypothetical protein
MTELLEHALETVRTLPPETQDAVARFLLQFVRDDEPVIQLTPEEDADLAAADEEIARGEFATNEEVSAIWAKHGL